MKLSSLLIILFAPLVGGASIRAADQSRELATDQSRELATDYYASKAPKAAKYPGYYLSKQIKSLKNKKDKAYYGEEMASKAPKHEKSFHEVHSKKDKLVKEVYSKKSKEISADYYASKKMKSLKSKKEKGYYGEEMASYAPKYEKGYYGVKKIKSLKSKHEKGYYGDEMASKAPYGKKEKAAAVVKYLKSKAEKKGYYENEEYYATKAPKKFEKKMESYISKKMKFEKVEDIAKKLKSVKFTKDKLAKAAVVDIDME